MTDHPSATSGAATIRERLLALAAKWRESAKLATALARSHEGDSAGNTHAFLKERRIWITCADELEEAASALPVDEPTEPS